MRRSRLIIPLVTLATMALMLSATGATAKPHQTLGEVSTECFINGQVTLTSNNQNNDPNSGLDNIPGSNHYEFRDTKLECDGKKVGVYAVRAEGDTADFWHQLDKPNTGADCEQGGSIAIDNDGDHDLDEVHTGILSAAETAGTSPDKAGLVHVVRLGSIVLADGPLWDGTLNVPDKPRPEPDQWFQAELVFTPKGGTCTKDDPIKEASLDGTAELYNDWIHLCDGDTPDKEEGKGHCDD